MKVTQRVALLCLSALAGLIPPLGFKCDAAYADSPVTVETQQSNQGPQFITQYTIRIEGVKCGNSCNVRDEIAGDTLGAYIRSTVVPAVPNPPNTCGPKPVVRWTGAHGCVDRWEGLFERDYRYVQMVAFSNVALSRVGAEQTALLNGFWNSMMKPELCEKPELTSAAILPPPGFDWLIPDGSAWVLPIAAAACAGMVPITLGGPVDGAPGELTCQGNIERLCQVFKNAACSQQTCIDLGLILCKFCGLSGVLTSN